MKCYYLMLAKYFPKKHPKAGEPTNFFDKINSGKKIHTIRLNYEFWEKRFAEIDKGKAYLSVREWTGEPYKSKQKELFRFDKKDGISLQKIERYKGLKDGKYFLIDDSYAETYEVATNDGLTKEDFNDWFKVLPKQMALIHFTNFNYDDLPF